MERNSEAKNSRRLVSGSNESTKGCAEVGAGKLCAYQFALREGMKGFYPITLLPCRSAYLHSYRFSVRWMCVFNRGAVGRAANGFGSVC